MPTLNIASPPSGGPTPGWVPFALGFRPFFLGAGLVAALLVPAWAWLWPGRADAPVLTYYGAVGWHAHEMLFGYTVAVIAGFLLTAVRNWTGRDTPQGRYLALMFGLWLLGRLAPWVSFLPGWIITLLDVAFLPVLAMSLLGPLRAGRNKVNLVFVPLLFAMAAANLMVHLEAQSLTLTGAAGIRLMIGLVLLLIVFVAGRVLPFFTANVIPGFEPRRQQWVESGTFLSLALVLFLGLYEQTESALAGGFLLLGILQAIRLRGWYHPRIWGRPVLLILHAGYLWLVTGCLLTGAALFALLPYASALHALVAGGIGVFTIGMMARVALGHSGRPLDVSRLTVVAFVIVNLAALLRVAGPLLVPAWYAEWIIVSAVLWGLGFGAFVLAYFSVLMRPRVDGRPG